MSDEEEGADIGTSSSSLPKGSIQKAARQALPAELKIASDFTEMLTECCTEFVEMLFSSANGISEKEKKSTITPEHIVAALDQLEFISLKESVASFAQSLKESKASSTKARRKTGAEQAGLSEEDQIAMQQRMFAEARAHAAGLS